MFDSLFGPLDLLIVGTFIGVVMAMVIWLRLKPKRTLDEESARVRDQQTGAVFAQIGDWANAAVNLVIGVLLGVAVHGVAGLVAEGAWAAVLTLAALAVALTFIVVLHERLGDWLFPSGIRPARNPKKKPRKSALRRFSLPVGLVAGVLLAWLGLGDLVLSWLS